jgi:hypothetical protein
VAEILARVRVAEQVLVENIHAWTGMSQCGRANS